MNNPPHRRRIPFLGVLGLRIALVAAATILLFNSSASHLKDLGYRLFDVEIPPYPDYGAIANGMAPMVDGSPPAAVSSQFSTWLNGVAEDLADNDVAFYVLDRAGRLVYCTPELEAVGSDVLTSTIEFRLEIDGVRAGFGHAALYPIASLGRRRGWFGTVSMFLSDSALDHASTAPVIALSSDHPIPRRHVEEESEQHAKEARYGRVRQIVDVSVPIVTALVLGGIASLLVTRRLLKMAAETRRVGPDRIPGPFDSRGSDEVAELARALNDMRTRNLELLSGLERRETARREWVAQVSHDLRTPLTSLQVCLERVHTAAAVGADFELEESVRLARHDAERLRTLAEDLLEAARLEGAGQLNIEPILPREVVHQALRSVRPLANRDGVELVFETDDGAFGAEWQADGARLVRACENLLRNAVRHARARVEVFVERTGDALRFRVCDDGEGFGGAVDAVDLRRAGVIGRGAGSSGLGLLVVERIAAAHGGRMGASNRPTGGAEVWFEIAIGLG